jgi:hypothetical protein
MRICKKVISLILYQVSSRLVTLLNPVMPLYRSLMFLCSLFHSSSLILSFKYSLSVCLKCLLALCCTLFKLSLFTSFGSCSHCSLACFFQSTNFEYCSSNHGL